MDEKAEERRTAEALEQFAGADEHAARAAFNWLFPRIERYLSKVFRTASLQDADSKDLLQDTGLRAWEHRNTFRNQGFSAWLSWMRSIAYNVMIDSFRKQKRAIPLEEWHAVPEEDLSLLDLLIKAVGRELYRLADVLWLELDATCSEEEHNRRLLATQLYYQDGWSSEEILTLLASTPSTLSPPTRSCLDTWFADKGTLRNLAYHELYYFPERLTAHLLGLSETPSSSFLDTLLIEIRSSPTTACPFADWTWQETQAILWRYFRCCDLDEIETRALTTLNSEERTALFARCVQKFPFIDKAIALHLWLDTLLVAVKDRQKVLGDSELWQRLAFEYRYRDELPLLDIHERTAPAAERVGYSISTDTLNTWLSGKRLLKRLVRYHVESEQRREAHA